MKAISSLWLLPAFAGALATSALAEPIATPAGNTGSPAGLSGGPGLGDTPSTAPLGVTPGDVPVRRAIPVTNGGNSNAGSGATGSSTGGDVSQGVTRSTGAGITDGSTRQSTGTPSYGAGMNTSGSAGRSASVPAPVVPAPVVPAGTAK